MLSKRIFVSMFGLFGAVCLVGSTSGGEHCTTSEPEIRQFSSEGRIFLLPDNDEEANKILDDFKDKLIILFFKVRSYKSDTDIARDLKKLAEEFEEIVIAVVEPFLDLEIYNTYNIGVDTKLNVYIFLKPNKDPVTVNGTQDEKDYAILKQTIETLKIA